MHELGRNPALMIPALEDFVTRNANGGRRMRAIGEAVWAERSEPEVIECEHHESLVNLAFADGHDLWILCPYDTATLWPSALRGATQTHPLIDDHGAERESKAYLDPDETGAPFDGPMPAPPRDAEELPSIRPTISETCADSWPTAQRARRSDLTARTGWFWPWTSW